MKTVMLGVLVCAGLVMAAAGATPGGNNEGLPRRPGPLPQVQANGDFIALSTVVGDKYQQLVVVDPKAHVMSVYHVDLASGAIHLRCVRNIHWDLQMMDFNGTAPLPREIQAQIQALAEPR
ncbi:MAG: hypothetical protein ABFD16_24560 [Thermoguttaceae bacterium]|jgi:hypothetical protein